MYKVIDEVLAADLEAGDLFDFDGDLYTVKTKDDQGEKIELVVTDKFDDDDDLSLDAFRPIQLLMEVDNDDT